MLTRMVRLGAAAALTVPALVTVPHAALHAGCALAADYAHHARVLVEHGNGQVLQFCVGFDASSLDGETLLRATGLSPGVRPYGAGLGDAICQIDGEPTSQPPDCFGQSSYWALSVSRSGSGWQTSSRGASSQTFADGDAAGFRYTSQSAPQPPAPLTVFCPVATPSPGPTASPTPPSPTASVGSAVPRTTPGPDRGSPVAPSRARTDGVLGIQTPPGEGLPSPAPSTDGSSSVPSASAASTSPPIPGADSADPATRRPTVALVGAAQASGPARAPSSTPSSSLAAAIALGAVAVMALVGVALSLSRRRRTS